MDYTYLHNINYPSDLKKLPEAALPRVCEEVRDFIVQQLSRNPGHLGSSLGTVELTVALHYVFDTPNDQLVWDVGHQAYAHKILTGRRERFHTNRQFKGIAPFPTPAESEYDAFIAGHASNSISAALGLAIGERREVRGERRKARVVAIIGDGAMTGGLAFEGLNNTSMLKNNLLIVLNDNNMAIDPLKGGFTQYLLDLTTSKRYNQWRWLSYRIARKLHIINDNNKSKVQRFTNNLKALLTKQTNNIFQGLNLRYFGPTDGHDVLELVRIFNEIKDYEGPKVLHIVTKKGKGYEPAENDQTTWHAPGEFLIETGERLKVKGERQEQLWQEVFGEELLALAKKNEKIVGITPAMPSGCSMNIMQQELPDRVFDVGIAEGHAVTFSAGLAKAGMKPYCNIYSSFLQRAYDNIIHDVALPKLPVVLCIDRAGIVGNDGATHHGLLDMAYLRPIPNMVIGAPMTAEDLREMMRLAQDYDGPMAIRYPRGRAEGKPTPSPFLKEGELGDKRLAIGKGVCLREAMRRESTPQTHEVCRGPRSGDEARGKRMAVLSIGAIGNTVAEAIDSLDGRSACSLEDERSACSLEDGRLACSLEDGRLASPVEGIAHYDMRWLKPIDEEILKEVAENYDTIVTVEDGMINGGLGSAVAEYIADRYADRSQTAALLDVRYPRVIRLGVKDQFVEHGSTKELYQMLKLDKEGLCESLLQALEQ